MKNIGLVLITLLFGTFLVSTAYAGPVQINTLNYFANGASYHPLTGVPDVDLIHPGWGSQTLLPGTYTPADGIPDAAAVSRVAEWIDTSTGSFIYNILSDSYEITMVISGIDDVLWQPTPGGTSTQFDLYSTGLHVDFYLDTSPDFSTFDGSGAGDGTLILSLDGHMQTGVDAFGTSFDYNLKSTYEVGTNESGGTAILDVVGGTWASLYDTNTVAAPFSAAGGPDFADFSFSFSLSDNTDPLVPITFELSGTGNGVGNVVPEPATMMLFGIGLIGLAGFSRRRHA